MLKIRLATSGWLALASGLAPLPAVAQESAGRSVDAPQIESRQDNSVSDTQAVQIDNAQASNRSAITGPQIDATRSSARSEISSEQLSNAGDSRNAVTQLSISDLEQTLAQLTNEERQVLLEAVQGEDVCNDPPPIEAIIELCQSRIETRASEFALAAADPISPEELLLGERLGDAANALTLERDVERIAENAGRNDADSLSTQAIASIALAAPQGAEPDAAAADPLGGLSAETQTLIDALIQHLGGATGGPPQ